MTDEGRSLVGEVWYSLTTIHFKNIKLKLVADYNYSIRYFLERKNWLNYIYSFRNLCVLFMIYYFRKSGNFWSVTSSIKIDFSHSTILSHLFEICHHYFINLRGRNKYLVLNEKFTRLAYARISNYKLVNFINLRGRNKSLNE